MYASIDFATKTEFIQAVRAGAPIVLYSPTLQMPAINGAVRVTGPWPLGACAATAAEVEAAMEQDRLDEETARGGRRRVVKSARHKRLRRWTAEVMVKNMSVVAAH